MIRYILIALTLLSAPMLTWADTVKSETEAKQLAEKVMMQVGKSNLSEAFALMKPYIDIPESEFQGLALQTKSKRDQFGTRYGETIGYEFVSEKKAGESILRFVYVEKAAKRPLPWVFIFYKKPSGWGLVAVFWNDQVQSAFQ